MLAAVVEAQTRPLPADKAHFQSNRSPSECWLPSCVSGLSIESSSNQLLIEVNLTARVCPTAAVSSCCALLHAALSCPLWHYALSWLACWGTFPCRSAGVRPPLPESRMQHSLYTCRCTGHQLATGCIEAAHPEVLNEQWLIQAWADQGTHPNCHFDIDLPLNLGRATALLSSRQGSWRHMQCRWTAACGIRATPTGRQHTLAAGAPSAELHTSQSLLLVIVSSTDSL